MSKHAHLPQLYPAVQGHSPDSFCVYSGTAAAELRLLQAPALGAIERINMVMPVGTAVMHGMLYGPEPKQQFEFVPADSGVNLLISAGTVPSIGGPAVEHAMRLFETSTTEPPPASSRAVDVDLADLIRGSVDECESLAFDTFKELVLWLQAKDEEIADMIGVGRTTPYTWKREGREPRRATLRRLYQTHAVVAALVRRLGQEATTHWLVVEDPTRRDRVLAGDFASVQREARPLLFGRRPRTRPSTWRPDEEIDE